MEQTGMERNGTQLNNVGLEYSLGKMDWKKAWHFHDSYQKNTSAPVQYFLLM